MTVSRSESLEVALPALRQPLKGIPFEVIVQHLYGKSVEKFDITTPENTNMLRLLVRAMRKVCNEVQRNPIVRPRPNEVGNDMEPFVIEAICSEDLRALRPKATSGKGKSTGYPDIKIVTSGTPIYLEVKTFARKNHSTTQRSFYFSPTDDPKVTEDAHHLAVGFEIVRRGNEFTPVAFEILDLYGLLCDLKSEFNSDNRRLYDNSRILYEQSVS